MTTLSGKTALVTGASRGIGRATALALAKAGAQVLVHYGRGAAEAEAVVREIRDAGGRADAVSADMAAHDGPHKLAAEARRIIGDRLDILVANAGIANAAHDRGHHGRGFRPRCSPSTCAHRSSWCSNCCRSWQGQQRRVCCRRSPRMPSVGTLSAYAATKGAIDTLVKHFAAALGARGIRVNAVAPGVVDTDMSSFARTDAGRDFTLGMQALNASRSRTTSAMRSPSWPRTTRAGSPATRSGSTAARNSTPNGARGRR